MPNRNSEAVSRLARKEIRKFGERHLKNLRTTVCATVALRGATVFETVESTKSAAILARMRSYEGKKITSPSRGFEV
jgi:hypothetical protein